MNDVLQSAGADDDPLNDAEDSAWHRYFKDMVGFEQIERDVERTHQRLPFFGADSDDARLHRKVRCLP